MNRSKITSFGVGRLCAWALCLQLPVSMPVLADTIVNVQSNLGEFKLELFEDKAPETVAHFLSNIEAGNYHFTMVHEVTSTIVFGGQYTYEECGEGPVLVPGVPSIPVESTGLTNIRRTIAMVRNQDDPTTVSGEWMINLGDNDLFFEADEKPIVFGEVIEGLSTVDAMADSWRVAMNVSLSVPTINYDGFVVVQCGLFTRDNVIKTSMQIESIDPPASTQAVNSFDPILQTLNIKVDAGASGLLSLSLLLQSSSPDFVVQVQPETVAVLTEAVEGMATFDAGSGNLTIPELSINDQVAYTNVVLLLTDAQNLFFTVQSAEGL